MKVNLSGAVAFRKSAVARIAVVVAPAFAVLWLALPIHADDAPESVLPTSIIPVTAMAFATTSTALSLPPRDATSSSSTFTSAQASTNTIPSVALPVAPSKPITAPPALPATNPVRIVIPAISVDAAIVGEGLEDGRMAVPHNFTQVGWYDASALPGAAGSSVMGAHVDNGVQSGSNSIDGVFKNLKNLKPGDQIAIYDASGTKLSFDVLSTQIFDKDATNTEAVFVSQGSAELNLITCYGQWLPAQNTYAQRLVVFAKLDTENQ